MTYADGRHNCRGYPEGLACPIVIPGDWIWCRDCRRRRQEELAAGIGKMERIDRILDESKLPELACQCGGDLRAVNHTLSLLHRSWEWKQSEANREAPGLRPTYEQIRSLGLNNPTLR